MSYLTNTRGHQWQLDKHGDIDEFAFEDGNYDVDTGYPHYGVKCVKCGYYLCIAHHEDAEHDCPSPTTDQACELV